MCGTAGSTPAAPSRIGNRRESNAFSTPMPLKPPSRPPSSLSDTGSKAAKQVSETPSTIGKTMLGKSIRANMNAPAPPSALKAARFSEGAMGPPTHKPRASLSSSTSSVVQSSLSRSSSARASSANATTTLSHHRRVSSSSLHHSLSSKAALMRSANAAADLSESDASSVAEEKENAAPTSGKSTPSRIARRSLLLPA